MNTKNLNAKAQSTIDEYLHFKLGSAVCSVPYFNNKVTRNRAALRVNAGKGNPKEIHEEMLSIIRQNHLDADKLADESLKKLLTDNNIGIDCSGFAFHVLNSQVQELRNLTLEKNINYINCKGILGKLRCTLRPVENCDVATLSSDENSTVVDIENVLPADIICLTASSESNDYDHILIIHQVDYLEILPTKIYYSQAVAYPEDGKYGTGIKQGTIEITDLTKPLTDQKWVENGNEGTENRILQRALKSHTRLRRLIVLNQ